MTCKSYHEAFESNCALEDGHEGVHFDGLLSWKDRIEVVGEHATGGVVVFTDPGPEAVKAVVKKVVARKRAPKKES